MDDREKHLDAAVDQVRERRGNRLANRRQPLQLAAQRRRRLVWGQPAAVLGDTERQDFVTRLAQRRRHCSRRGQGDLMLDGAAAEDESYSCHRQLGYLTFRSG